MREYARLLVPVIFFIYAAATYQGDSTLAASGALSTAHHVKAVCEMVTSVLLFFIFSTNILFKPSWLILFALAVIPGVAGVYTYYGGMMTSRHGIEHLPTTFSHVVGILLIIFSIIFQAKIITYVLNIKRKI